MIIPIAKTAKASLPMDYRPISLLSIVGKIAEAYVVEQLRGHLDMRLPSWQYGFRSKRGLTDALIGVETCVVEAWGECKASKKPTSVAVLSLHLSKTFDTLPHHYILQQLHRKHGLHGPPLKWFSSYLRDRDFVVKVGGCTSSVHAIRSGVPQGSILGPLLYIAATAAIGDLSVSPGTRIEGYADDLLLIKPMLNEKSASDFNNDISMLNKYFTDINMTFNHSKTKLVLMSLSHRTGRRDLGTGIVCGGQLIIPSQQLKYLGVQLDERLSMRENALSAVARVRKCLFASLITLQRAGQRPLLVHIYRQILRPILTHGIEISWGISKTVDAIFSRTDKLAARLAIGSSWLCYTEALAQLRVPGLEIVSQRRRLAALHSYINCYCDAPTDSLRPIAARRSTRLGNGNQYGVFHGSAEKISRCKKCALRRACDQWNRLDESVVRIKKSSTFKRLLRRLTN